MAEPLDDGSVLALTKDGEAALHEPGTTLAPRHLQALVLIDGQASVLQVLHRAPQVPGPELRSTLAELVEKGFASVHEGLAVDALDAGDFFSASVIHPDLGTAGDEADAEAAANAEFLRHNGYCVNLARRGDASRKPPKGRRPLVLIVDDDPDIRRLLRTYLKLEGFETREAGDRDAIVSEIRRMPLADVVLLDVGLPDVNGFDVLARLRQHPVLKDLPVIMLTGEATREAVLRGILGGADGYITKPFEIHPLVRALKAVLGMAADGGHDWDYSL